MKRYVCTFLPRFRYVYTLLYNKKRARGACDKAGVPIFSLVLENGLICVVFRETNAKALLTTCGHQKAHCALRGGDHSPPRAFAGYSFVRFTHSSQRGSDFISFSISPGPGTDHQGQSSASVSGSRLMPAVLIATKRSSGVV